MRAAVYRRYGPPEVVRIEDVPKPVPKDNEILVRIRATTVSAADWRFRRPNPFLIRVMNGLWRPKKIKILGTEFSGTVESVGNKVTRYAAGDQVFGLPGLAWGAHAEYVCMPESGVLAERPKNLPFEDAAGVLFGGLTALCFLRGRVQAGSNVLVYGASSSVGTSAVQLAKHFGARVTAVCSTANLELARKLGADEVTDYLREDYAQAGRVYDMFFDAVGKSSVRRSMSTVKRGGYNVQASLAPAWNLGAMWMSLTGSAKPVSGIIRPTSEDALELKKLIEAGKFRPVIDRRYSLGEIAEAHRYAEAGHKRGNVLVIVSPT